MGGPGAASTAPALIRTRGRGPDDRGSYLLCRWLRSPRAMQGALRYPLRADASSGEARHGVRRLRQADRQALGPMHCVPRSPTEATIARHGVHDRRVHQAPGARRALLDARDAQEATRLAPRSAPARARRAAPPEQAATPPPGGRRCSEGGVLGRPLLDVRWPVEPPRSREAAIEGRARPPGERSPCVLGVQSDEERRLAVRHQPPDGRSAGRRSEARPAEGQRRRLR